MRLEVVVPDDGRVTVPWLEERLRVWSAPRGHEVTVRPVAPDAVGATAAATLDAADGVLLGATPGLVDGEIVELVGDRAHRLAVVDLDQHRVPQATLDAAGIRRVHGRGIETYRWAAQALAAQLTSPATRHAYGADPDQFGELRLPDGPGPHPVVVLLHGGFWHTYWELDLMDEMAIDLTARGYATWNLEYRRGAGAVRDTLADVAAGIDHLRTLDRELGGVLDLDRVGLTGHSAGGHLVLWAAARVRHGAPQALDPAVCVPLAPVTDLRQCADRGLGDGAAREFLGARPAEAPDRYAEADPMDRLPVGCPVTIVQGLADGPDFIDLCRVYAAAAAAHGETVTLLELPDANHFHVIDPASAAWPPIVEALAAHLRPQRERSAT